MLERTGHLFLVIRQRFLLLLDVALFLFGLTIKSAQYRIDARDGAQRAFGIEIGPVRLLAPDEQIRFAILISASTAQDFESLVMPSYFERLIILPRHDDGIEGVSSVLARSLSREFLVADLHREVLLSMRVPRGNISRDGGMVFLPALNALGKAFDAPADIVLLVDV